jgi:hypothetical protein
MRTYTYVIDLLNMLTLVYLFYHQALLSEHMAKKG